jgi:hypothetical protein
MIRLGKPVQVLEWGVGTNTTNQRWTEIAKGRFVSKPKLVDGLTVVQIEVEGSVTRHDSGNDFVKLMQQGEGTVPASQTWGEVAMGTIGPLVNQSGKTVIEVKIKAATKYSN